MTALFEIQSGITAPIQDQALSPIFLRIQIQLMRLLVGLLVGQQLLPSFYIVWYDLPTNNPTNYPNNIRIVVFGFVKR